MLNSEQACVDGSLGSFAKRVVLFCLPLALAWLGLEWGMTTVPNSHSLKQTRLETLRSEVDTLIVGSSRAYYGISPWQLSGSAFNLANVSQTLYYDDQLLTQQAPRLAKLRRVIVEVSYFSLGLELHDTDEDWRQYYYQHVWGIPPQRQEDRNDIRMWSLVALYSPRSSLSIAGHSFASLAPEVDARGWYAPTTTQPSTPDLGEAAAAVPLARHHRMMRASSEPANTAALEHLISMLRKLRVEVVLVTLPVWHTYADGMRPDGWARSQAIFERVSQEYGARYRSFLREPRLEPPDFLDTDHLSMRGAIRFTQMLNGLMDAPGARVPQFTSRNPGPAQRRKPEARRSDRASDSLPGVVSGVSTFNCLVHSRHSGEGAAVPPRE